MSYYVEEFQQFIGLVCSSIESISPQTDYLMRLWQIKHAEDTSAAEKVLTLVEGRDSYERSDNYNVYGLFCFHYLKMERAFTQWINPVEGKTD